jgi:hypothetical protein
MYISQKWMTAGRELQPGLQMASRPLLSGYKQIVIDLK